MAKNQAKVSRGDREKILTELRAICFENLSGLVDEDGKIIRPPDDDPKWRLIKKIKIVTIENASYTKTTTEIEAYDKLSAINLLCKIEGIDGLANMIKAIKGAGFDIFDRLDEAAINGADDKPEIPRTINKPIQGSLFDS